MSNKKSTLKISHKTFWLLPLVCFALNTIGCADSFQGSMYNDEDVVSENTQILGGDAVNAKSKYSQKVLFLALGVKIIKTPNSQTAAVYRSHCTAVAISAKILLTAAHCVKNLTADETYLVLSTTPKKQNYDTNRWIKAQTIKVHENFSFKNQLRNSENLYDIALIRLTKPIDSKHLSLLAATKELDVANKNNADGIMIGYGLRNNNPEISTFEKRENSADLFYVRKKLPLLNSNNSTFLIDQRDGVGICSGDSGGPLLTYDETKKDFIVIGILSGYSWLTTETDSVKPSPIQKICLGDAVYSNITFDSYKKWINETALSLN